MGPSYMDDMTIDIIAVINDQLCTCAQCSDGVLKRVDEIQTLPVDGLAKP